MCVDGIGFEPRIPLAHACFPGIFFLFYSFFSVSTSGNIMLYTPSGFAFLFLSLCLLC